MTIMARNNKSNGNGSWKKERASVNRKDKARPRSNKYSSSDSSKRRAAGSAERYWRAGYTRKDGTHVKGHYVKNPHHQ
jgi:hypothetical protein